MSEQLDHNGYPTAPRTLRKGAWFYEQPCGIIVMSEPIDDKIGASEVVIPWRKIIAAVKRHSGAKRNRQGARK